MTVFVNYYPCSYGESLTNMFGNIGATRFNHIVRASCSLFKEQDFYQLDQTQQFQILQNLDQEFYPCHRQNTVNFGNNVVVSLVLDVIDFLPKRYQVIHLPRHSESLSNSQLLPLIGKVSFDKLILKDYEIWARNNILSSDHLIFFSWILDDNSRLEQFCLEHGFHYSQSQIDEIKSNIKQWM